MLMFIIGMSLLFSYVMSYLHISQSTATWIVDQHLSRWVLLAMILVLVIVLGFFLPPVSIILMLAPIILPPLKVAGFDLVWFGVLMTIVMETGLIHPPVGLNIFVIKNIAPDIPLPDIIWGVMPFVVLMFVAVVLICVFPGIATGLPDVAHGCDAGRLGMTRREALGHAAHATRRPARTRRVGRRRRQARRRRERRRAARGGDPRPATASASKATTRSRPTSSRRRWSASTRRACTTCTWCSRCSRCPSTSTSSRRASRPGSTSRSPARRAAVSRRWCRAGASRSAPSTRTSSCSRATSSTSRRRCRSSPRRPPMPTATCSPARTPRTRRRSSRRRRSPAAS